MKITDLSGTAREHFEYWRYTVGLDEAAALRQVEASGVVEFEQLRESFEGMFLAKGYSPERAKEAGYRAACGRDGPPPHPDGYERMRQIARDRGSTEAGADAFACGRGLSESEARAGFAEAARESVAVSETEMREAFSEATRAAARSYGWSQGEAERWIAGKVRTDWAGLGVAGRVARLREYAAAFGSGPAPVREGGRAPRREELRESARPRVPIVPVLVARVDELVEAGVSEREARRRAYRDMYGHDPGSKEGVVS